MRDQPEVLLATVLFRWFNRIETGEAIFQQTGIQSQDGTPTEIATAWDCHVGSKAKNWTPVLHDAITAYCGGGPYVTGAYIIKTPDGVSKLEGVLWCLEQFMLQEHDYPGATATAALGWREVADMLLANRTWDDPEARFGSLEQTWSWLRQFPYMGDFMAYEVVTDLRHTALLDWAPDVLTWANPGPGAARGLSRLLYDDPSVLKRGERDRGALVRTMRLLLEASRDPEYWPQACGSPDDAWLALDPGPLAQVADIWDPKDTAAWPAWEMRDVEHTLCEWDKYERARTGEGRMKRRYVP